MYTTVIGRRFLNAYNKREGTNLTAKKFFEEIFIPIFYNHPKYMMTGGNSPLENPKISWKQGKYPDEKERKDRINKTINKIENNDPDVSIAIGYSSLDLAAPTSSQTTNMNIKFSKEDMYLSWIGSGLGLGIKGGLILLFENEQVLLNTFDGWNYYRSFLNDDAYYKLRGNQITTWNGQWITHISSFDFLLDKPLMNFSEKAFETTKEGIIEIPTIHWVELILSISRCIKASQINSYVYNLSNENTTLGFIPFKLYEIAKPIQLYKKIFGENNFLKDAKIIESIYGSAFGFAAACRQGQIGIQALEPKGLREFMTSNRGTAKLPNYTKANEETIINYNTYITWVIAMLDNEKLWELAGEAAEHLITFIKTDEKDVSTKRSNIVLGALDANSKKQFLESLIPIIKQIENPKPFVDLGEEINKMVSANFPYFQTLIRFRYAEKNK